VVRKILALSGRRSLFHLLCCICLYSECSRFSLNSKNKSISTTQNEDYDIKRLYSCTLFHSREIKWKLEISIWIYNRTECAIAVMGRSKVTVCKIRTESSMALSAERKWCHISKRIERGSSLHTHTHTHTHTEENYNFSTVKKEAPTLKSVFWGLQKRIRFPWDDNFLKKICVRFEKGQCKRPFWI